MLDLKSRSTGDILVLLIAGTICFSVLASGFTVALLAFVRPEEDSSSAVGIISDTINTLIGLLAGFLAGRTDASMKSSAQIIEMESRRASGNNQ